MEIGRGRWRWNVQVWGRWPTDLGCWIVRLICVCMAAGTLLMVLYVCLGMGALHLQAPYTAQ